MENYAGDAEFQKFLEATNYIQQYTGGLLRRDDSRSPKILEHLSSINQLIDLVKQLLAEQQEKVATANSRQRNNVNAMIKDNKFHNASLPSTSTNNHNNPPPRQNLSQQLDAAAGLHQDFNLEQILGRIQSNFNGGVIDQPMYSQQSPPTTSSGGLENGNNNFQNLLDPNQFFDASSSSPSPPPQNGRHQQKANGKSSLKNHRVSLNLMPVGPYQCQNCDKSFRQKHGLTQHSLTHESIGAFECDGCGKRYSRQESVYRHQRSTQCCPKYHSLTNVRHHETTSTDAKNAQQLIPPRFLM